ncbi:MAG: flagellar export chaperone FliS [Porticoccaceae bacterium]|nr:flagellar export chaperone FliS [Porticoccaceae bacterium]
MTASALKTYNSVGVQSDMGDANPHQLIGKLLNGALDRIASAKGAIGRDENSLKGELLGKAIAIVDGLRASLDHQNGGEIATNLASLYDYMEQRLLEANLNNDIERLDEVAGLLKEIKAGWDEMPAEHRTGR